MTNTTSSRLDIGSVRDMSASTWTASMHLGREGSPTVVLQRSYPYQERYAYALASMLDAVADGRGFNFGDFSSYATTHRLSPVALATLAVDARRRIPGTVGRFEVRWVPNDPNVPF